MKTRLRFVLIVVLVCATSRLVHAAGTPTSFGPLPPVVPSGQDGWLLPASEESLTSTVPLTEVNFDDCYVRPQWTVWAGAIFLTRNSPNSQTLLSSGGTPFFNAQQFNFGTSAGPDINFIRQGERFGVDFRYFQVNNIQATRTIIPGLTPLQLELADPVNVGNDILSQSYGSSLQSVELNARRNVGANFAVLAGFRYISLQEDLRTRFDLPLDLFPAINFDVDAINRLYGGQIGVDGTLWSAGRFQLLSTAKAGVYGNTANNAARMSVFGDGDFSYGTSATTVSFVGDLNFSGVMQLTDHWACAADTSSCGSRTWPCRASSSRTSATTSSPIRKW